MYAEFTSILTGLFSGNRGKAKLEAEGIKVIPIPWDENIRSGGGLHCGTCPLMREYV